MKRGAIPAPLWPAAAAAAAALLWPWEGAQGWTVLGGQLSLAQRHVRVCNNFTDPEANDNTSPHPEWPGYVGAELAIWKAATEWCSELHGLTGNGDPHQPGGLGSGGASFDVVWLGNASSPGGLNDNTHSELSGNGGGVLAFTETPISDGWRIRYYADPWIWHDGPGDPGGGPADVDLQGIATHEYGHALGLGHSAVPGATMGIQQPGTGNLGVEARSIEPDDQSGIQAVYGVIDPTKPHIAAVAVTGGVITVTGAQFALAGNELWFTPASAGGGPATVQGLASNGTTLQAAVPAGAGPGDVLVKKGGSSGNEALSNAFPFDPGSRGEDYPVALNLDIGVSYGTPGNLQGQAAGSPGVWNAIAPPVDNLRLVDLSGAMTTATVSSTGINGEYSFNNPATTGAAQKLLDDMEDIGCNVGAQSTWTLQGIAAGDYDVYVYAWAPDQPLNYFTEIAVAGGLKGPQVVGGGNWIGTHVYGQTYTVDTVNVPTAGGSISITATTVVGCGSLNGIQIVPARPCGSAVSYCTPGVSASGCQATLAAVGVPSASAASGFVLSAASVEGNKDGLFFFGTHGRQANPWGNGTSLQCVVPPVVRTGLMAGSGSNGACDGVFSADFNSLWCPACPSPQKNPGPGALVQVQLWYRDPLNTSNQTTSLSDALELAVCP